MDYSNYVQIEGEYFSIKHPKAKAYLESMAFIHPKVTKSNQRRESKDWAFIPSPEGVHYCITIVVFRRRLLDSHDNARSACKKLCDLITLCLGFKSDDCPELEWEYHQCKTNGVQGTQIIISTKLAPL